MGSWADFFSAELGAAAALTGLVIVGISINIARILAEPGLPGRAAETLVLKLVIIERIERMITEKENSRNTMLRQIDRHRDGVAQRLRDVATQIEDAEFRGIPRTDAAE